MPPGAAPIPPAKPRHVLAIDLAAVGDYAALAALEVHPGRLLDTPTIVVRQLKRWKLGTPYLRVVADLLAASKRPELHEPVICYDQTGVGRPVGELILDGAECLVVPVTITSGQAPTADPEGGWRVPKKDLAAVVQLLLGEKRLLAEAGLKEWPALKEELHAFRLKITESANATYGAKAGSHDDLVLAVAVGCWVCCNAMGDAYIDNRAASRDRSVISQAPYGVWETDGLRGYEGRRRSAYDPPEND